MLILAAMMALTTISGMESVPVPQGMDTTVRVFYEGYVIMPTNEDPEEVYVAIYNDEDRLIGFGYCESDDTFSIVCGATYVTDDVQIILTNYNPPGNPTRSKDVPDKWGSYSTYGSGYLHNAGSFDFTTGGI